MTGDACFLHYGAPSFLYNVPGQGMAIDATQFAPYQSGVVIAPPGTCDFGPGFAVDPSNSVSLRPYNATFAAELFTDPHHPQGASAFELTLRRYRDGARFHVASFKANFDAGPNMWYLFL